MTCIVNYDANHDPSDGKENEHIKTIVKTKFYASPMNPHKFNLKNGARMVEENGDTVDRFALRVPITRNRSSMHHFASKSREQFGESKTLFLAHQVVLGIRSSYFDDTLQSKFKEGITQEFTFENDSLHGIVEVCTLGF